MLKQYMFATKGICTVVSITKSTIMNMSELLHATFHTSDCIQALVQAGTKQ